MGSSFFSYITDQEKRKRLWELIKVTASHHPHCDNYNGHVFNILGVKTCRGCSIYYPTASISVILIWLVPDFVFERSIIQILLLGLFFALPTLIHMTKIDKKIDREFSILGKFMLGIGVGFFLRFLFIVPWVFKLIFLGIVIIFFIAIHLVHFKNFWNECKECPELPYREKFDHCSGLKPINSLLDQEVVLYFDSLTPDEKKSLVQLEIDQF